MNDMGIALDRLLTIYEVRSFIIIIIIITLTAYIFGMKHDIDTRSTTRGILHRFITSWTLVHKRLKTWPAFLPTLRKFCILLHCQASQMEISKLNSTKLCQTADGKSR